MTLEEILKAIDTLSDEDKAKLKAKVQDVEKAEDEREIDKIEEEKSDVSETAETEEVRQDVAEVGKDIDEKKEVSSDENNADEIKDEVVDNPADASQDDASATEELSEDSSAEIADRETTQDNMAQDNYGEIIQGLIDRLEALENQLAQMSALKEKMEEFSRKRDEAFGYDAKVPGAKKDYSSMTADELRKEIAVKI